PGHYRVAIAQDMNGLPAEPKVTAGGGYACGSTVIDPNPMLPLLADGLFVHTHAFTGPQTAKIQLPPGYTCKNCTLQVMEFMSQHGAPCFYHHCANVSIVPNTAVDDGGLPPLPDLAATDTPPPAMSEGCSYTATSAGSATLLHFAPLLGLAL